MSYQNIFSYLTYAYKEKFRQVDFLIFFSLLIFFLIQKSISFEALSFIGLFLLISSHAFEADRRPYTFNLIFKGILYSSLVSLLGVYLGFFESLFFDSTLFHIYQGENYPNPVLAFSKEAFGIAEDAVKIGAKVLWLQLGIRDENAKKLVEKNNIEYVENKCTKMEYQKFFLKIRQAFPVLTN